MANVAIIDDDPMVRELLRIILRAGGHQIVGDATDGDAAVGLIKRTSPDVLLMDLRMVRMGGIEATREVKKLPKAPGIIAITSFDTPEDILAALNAGVNGFIAKDTPPQEICQAVTNVAAGEGALSPRATRVVMEQMRRNEGQPANQVEAQMLGTLTSREAEVADLVAEGLTNVSIARKLGIAESTVKTHLNSALDKTGTSNRTQLAALVAANR